MKTAEKNRILEISKDFELISEHLDINYCLNEDFEDLEEFRDYLEDRINEQEVIYYSRALDFLKDNDNSLRDSLNLAYEMGFDVQNLSSEVLATLLLQEMIREEVVNFINELEKEDIFNN